MTKKNRNKVGRILNNGPERKAVLVVSPPKKGGESLLHEVIQLYERMTGEGTFGPSNIFLLAPEGTKYADMPPSGETLLKTLGVIRDSFTGEFDLFLYLSTVFEMEYFNMGEDRVENGELLQVINTLDFSSSTIILNGPGSDKLGSALHGKDRLVIYSGSTDRTEDFTWIRINELINGETVTMESYDRERERMKENGIQLVLHWE
jgi:hypothetical protein